MYANSRYARPMFVQKRAVGPKPLSAASALRPATLELILLAVATLLAMFGSAYGRDVVGITNYAVPILLILGLAWGCYTLALRNIGAIWAPLFWNRVVLIAYFGVGSIVPYLVNDETRELIESFYYFFPEDVGKYNLLNCVFIGVYQLTSIVLLGMAERRWKTTGSLPKIEPSSLDIRAIGLILIGVGLTIYYGLILPFALKIIDTPIPLLIGEMAQATLIGLFLLTVWSLQNRSPMIFAVLIVMGVQFFLGIIQLNKSESIFPVIMVAVGFIYHRPTLKRMLASFALILSLFLVIAPMVGSARNYAYGTVVDTRELAIGTRVEALAAYWVDEEVETLANPYQSGWMRLSYVNGATFAINAYDQGLPGNSLENSLIVFVPRIIYPDKPSITGGGLAFNVAVQGVDTSASTPGIPAEGYWNAGWFGVVGIAMFVSLVFTSWSVYTLAVLNSGAWHLFFIVLLGMRAGARLDGMFVPDVLGPISYAVVGHIALQFLNRLIAKRVAAPRLATG